MLSCWAVANVQWSDILKAPGTQAAVKCGMEQQPSESRQLFSAAMLIPGEN